MADVLGEGDEDLLRASSSPTSGAQVRDLAQKAGILHGHERATCWQPGLILVSALGWKKNCSRL